MDEIINCVCGKEFKEKDFKNHFKKCNSFTLKYENFDFTLSMLLKLNFNTREDLKCIKFLLKRFVKLIDFNLKKSDEKQKDKEENIVNQNNTPKNTPSFSKRAEVVEEELEENDNLTNQEQIKLERATKYKGCIEKPDIIGLNKKKQKKNKKVKKYIESLSKREEKNIIQKEKINDNNNYFEFSKEKNKEEKEGKKEGNEENKNKIIMKIGKK